MSPWPADERQWGAATTGTTCVEYGSTYTSSTVNVANLISIGNQPPEEPPAMAGKPAPLNPEPPVISWRDAKPIPRGPEHHAHAPVRLNGRGWA